MKSRKPALHASLYIATVIVPTLNILKQFSKFNFCVKLLSISCNQGTLDV